MMATMSATATQSAPLGSVNREREFLEKYEGKRIAVYYLVEAEWFRRWAKYVKNQGPRPGPILNSHLLQAGGVPKPGLIAGKDYRGVGIEVWRFLQEIHGGNPEIICPFLNIYHPGRQVVETHAKRSSRSSEASTSTSSYAPSDSEAEDLAASRSDGSRSEGRASKYSTLYGKHRRDIQQQCPWLLPHIFAEDVIHERRPQHVQQQETCTPEGIQQNTPMTTGW
eukprot:CAMPEP_0178418810 /NCGR_PEP_ID=MMETSP0689_2-20121128/25282_1 /TAXON_ID=160604 /ORGANISM="Amphidinium massartii, Strain CS-259" /LENGTH=223 /DNA_ID=CAMNT_0020040219 /DNA_START=18 /DNA_END=685 /DNA_ORIENTATION=+